VPTADGGGSHDDGGCSGSTRYRLSPAAAGANLGSCCLGAWRGLCLPTTGVRLQLPQRLELQRRLDVRAAAGGRSCQVRGGSS